MKLCRVTMLLLPLVFVSALTAQTKITGKQHCQTPRVIAREDAGDEAGHTLTLEKNSCTWLTPLQIAGATSNDGSLVAFWEAGPHRAATNGTYVGNMDSGDKFYIEFHWATLKDGTPPETLKGYWAFTGGTGKLKGITGSGTYSATENENGGEVNMEGEYSVTVPARK